MIPCAELGGRPVSSIKLFPVIGKNACAGSGRLVDSSAEWIVLEANSAVLLLVRLAATYHQFRPLTLRRVSLWFSRSSR